MSRSTLSILLVLGALVMASPVSASGLSCSSVPALLKDFLTKHYSFRYLNNELRQRTVDSYIKRLDPSRSMLLTSEEEQLAIQLRGVFHEVSQRDCTTLLEVRNKMIKHYEQVEVFVTEYVGSDDYELDSTVELIIDPEKRARPRTAAERDDLYRRLIHFQMSNYLSTDMELTEAKEKLIHRYELSLKRATEFDQEDTYSLFLDAFATALDPHSSYFSQETNEDFKIQMGLSLIGIGVALSSRDGYSIVEKVIPGGAAHRVGELLPNDKVIAVAQDGEEAVDIIDMDLRKVVRLIRGERHTKVHLTILRQSPKTERFVVTIERDLVNLEEQAAKLTFEPIIIDGKEEKLAVIDLPSFYGGRTPSERKSSTDLRSLLKEAADAKAVGLLLDLSRNGGGLLDTARDIAGFFIREGNVVAVKDEYGNVQHLRDDDPRILFDGPMIVLTSRISASASEIVAGAMKDYHRAVLVGDDHTFGKGTVQTLVPLPPGLGALKVTTALFFRPGGDSTQHSGVASDIVLPSPFNTPDFGESNQTYALATAEIAPFLETSANLVSGGDKTSTAYEPVSKEIVSELIKRSAARIADNEDFAEVTRKLQESEERAGIIRLSEIMKENEEAEREEAAKAEANKTEGKIEDKIEGKIESKIEGDASSEDAESEKDAAPAAAEEEEPEEPTIQRVEAIEILRDYVRLSRSSSTETLTAELRKPAADEL
ncbi:MAG: carboxy terminal-processing peptidase [Myxococcota bacterium]|nr:carboxy terminal-processing peptidase [Myxococcota bacterium]